ncbi:hypothetical protein B0H16DRAFT_288470 [Mycena metata]|uniref:Uncharacterized protein n=1 Tax=Mycena metata TaxID=1033252 RepID=A0AAD7HNS1_9AGAR|nr:hypothetical protein B0H16DRAFT_288470 [Mycena metata]
MTGQRLTHREMLSYGFKQGEPWAEQRRDLERSFNRGGRQDSNGLSNRSHSMSSGLPGTPHAPGAHRQHSTSSAGHSYARHSGYGSSSPHREEYASPSPHSTYAHDPWAMQLRAADPYQRSLSSRVSSPASSYASGRSYSHGYAPSSSYAPTGYHSRGGSSRYSGYGYASSGSSTGYAPRPVYETEDDGDYTYTHAPSSVAESEPHYASSGYAEAAFVIEPSDSGSETSYSEGHSSYDDESGDSGSGYSGSEGDSIYSEGADDEYDDDDDGYSDDGGYYSDD